MRELNLDRGEITMIKTVLFDLDRTLLPMDQMEFTMRYFKALLRKMTPLGYDPEKLKSAVWQGTGDMIRNIGSEFNETVYWRRFFSLMGEDKRDAKKLFEDFYINDFNSVQEICGFEPRAGGFIKSLKERGYNLILASNPIFPETAQIIRLRWAGVDPDDFTYITSYENSSWSKPNPAYYTEIVEKLGIRADECLMVGNDATEDMIAATIGMHVFLMTDWLLNRKGLDISVYRQGSFEELSGFLEELG